MRDFEANLQSIILSLFDSTYRYISKSTPSIFLIGSALKNRSSGFREKIRRLIEKRSPYHRGYEVYYPEDLFDELMKSNKRFNLLDLENMLAKSVHGIVILLSSPGSIAELGSFANNENLLNKLIVVIEKKYKKKNSFIMLGPVKLIKDRNKDRVIFYDPLDTDFAGLINKIKKELSKNIKTHFEIDETINNPIALQVFI